MAIEYIEQLIDTVDPHILFYEIYSDYEKYDQINREYCKNYLMIIFSELYGLDIDLQIIRDMDDRSEIVQRREQNNFRQMIVRRFDRCLISDIHNESCQASHIHDLADEPLNYNLNNGILLSATLHMEFDRLKWCIDPHTYRIVLSSKYCDQNLEIKKYIDRDLRSKLVHYPQMLYYLKKKFQKFTDDQQ